MATILYIRLYHRLSNIKIRKRSLNFMKWFLLFLLLPILELFVFFKINNIFGTIFTISLIILTAVLGSLFVKSQGRDVINGLMNKNNNPLILISNGLILLIAGILLLTPGFITDIIGFLFLIPNIRKFIIAEVSRYIQKN